MQCYCMNDFRIAMDIIISVCIFFTPWFKDKDGISTWYWTLLMVLYLLEEVMYKLIKLDLENKIYL